MQLLGQPLRHQGGSLHQGLVPSQRLGLVDLAEQILALLGREPAVAVIKLPPLGSAGPLHGL